LVFYIFFYIQTCKKYSLRELESKKLDAIVSSFGIDGFKYLFSSINSLMEEELLRPSEVAKKFGISVKTLWKWQRKSIIRAVRLPTGKLRYPKSEVERLWRQLRATGSQ